ncbi:hypothetical protein TPENAI_61253 [Tenacibaculum litopenaei]
MQKHKYIIYTISFYLLAFTSYLGTLYIKMKTLETVKILIYISYLFLFLASYFLLKHIFKAK